MNQCTFVGYVGQDAEVKQLTADFAVSEFRIGISDKVKGEKRTSWIPVKAMGIAAVPYYKGDKVIVFGKLIQESWVDRETGKKRSKLIVQSFWVEIAKPALNRASAHQENVEANFNDDIPF